MHRLRVWVIVLILFWGTSALGWSHPEHDRRETPPILVRIYSALSRSCQWAEPVWIALQQRYKDDLRFVSLNVTDAQTTEAALKQAKALGLSRWFRQSKLPTLALLHPISGTILKTYRTETDITQFTRDIDDLLARL